jgi:IS1 family transposase
MNFIPEQSKKAADVPYFENVTASDGWQGQSTTKSIETLKSEIVQAISRLGGTVQSFQRGKFQIGEIEREGFQVSYFIETSTGKLFNGRVDIAALPNKYDPRSRSNIEKRREQSLKMALFMFRNAMDGLWFLQQLSPGYSGLIPWMLPEGSDETLTQLWSKTAMMDNLLPRGDGDFVEGKYHEI